MSQDATIEFRIMNHHDVLYFSSRERGGTPSGVSAGRNVNVRVTPVHTYCLYIVKLAAIV